VFNACVNRGRRPEERAPRRSRAPHLSAKTTKAPRNPGLAAGRARAQGRADRSHAQKVPPKGPPAAMAGRAGQRPPPARLLSSCLPQPPQLA
jgi:hypothetical protein